MSRASTERPAHSNEAEVSVLGAMLIDAEAAARSLELLTPAEFHSPRHQLAFAAMGELFDRGEVIDPVTLDAELRRRGQSDRCGGHDYIAELMDAVASSSNVEHHARIVRQDAQVRRLAHAAREGLAELTTVNDFTPDELVERFEARITKALDRRSGTASTAAAMLPTVFADLEKRIDAGGAMVGVPTGFAELDAMTGGWQSGQFVILAARPTMGKSAFAINTALHAASSGFPVDIYSLEMTREELTYRMLSQEALLDLSRLIRGDVQDHEYAHLAQASEVVRTAPLWMEEEGALSIRQLRAKVLRRKIENPEVRVVIVDYIQLMTGGGEENRQQEISTISRGLKALAKEAKVCLIGLSQLSRNLMQRAEKRPQLSDLRESGALEQDADSVCFIHRPEYYMTPQEARDAHVVNKAELIIAKQRNGPTGTVDLYFRAECCRFEQTTPTIGGSL